MTMMSLRGSMIVALWVALVLGALFVAGCGEPGAQPLGERKAMTDAGSFEVVWEPAPDPIELNEFFTMTVQVMDGATGAPLAADAELIVDANMPLHGHGMETQPVATANGDGTWHVEGMLFHMPGEWDLVATVNAGGTVETAIFKMIVE